MSRPSADLRFRGIYDETYARVFAYCLRRAPYEDAKDAAADVYLILWRRLDEVPTGASTLPWLYVTARYVVANQRRSKERQLRLWERIRRDGQQHVDSPEVIVVRRAEDREVLAAISKLSLLDQEVIRLAVWEELPQTGIGDVIGCSDRAVTMRLHRAKRRLARHLRTDETETPIRPVIEQREAQHE